MVNMSKMKQKTLITVICLFVLISSNVMSLSVTKSVADPLVKVGDNVTIILTFDNPHGQKIPIQVHSKDIIGANGFDIQCYDFMLPKDPQISVQIAQIVPYEPGNYVLDATNITFVDPDTGKHTSITSNKVNVTVTGDALPGTTQKITSIYQCNGQSMQYTQTTQTNVPQSAQKNRQDEQKAAQQRKTISQSQKDKMQQRMNNKLQNNQMSQDANALKKEMQKQQQEQDVLKKEFEKRLSEDKQLQDMKKKLEEQGYKQTSKNIDPKTNDTGDFRYNFEKDGEQAQISGSMKDSKMGNISKTSTEDAKKLQQMLNNNTEYKKFEQELKKQGFNQTEFRYNTRGNMTNTVSQFKNKKGEIANISTELHNETITRIYLEQDKKRNYWYLLVLLLPLIFLYLFYKKRNLAEEVVSKKPKQKPFDFRKAAKEMLKKASRSYEEKKYKDAYEDASKALRLYFSYKYGTGKEITATETIRLLKSKKKPHANVQKCLNLCGLVEFAKYKPNKKDFDDIIKRAEKEII